MSTPEDSYETRPVIGFLKNALPRLDDGAGWNDLSVTAYQIGCEALVALGQAQERTWGAEPLPTPRLPTPLPRWDDICIAVLRLAGQQSLISYRHADGSLPPPRKGPGDVIVRPAHAPAPPPPNIAARPPLGAALATPEVLQALQALGLVSGDTWTTTAELVFWRVQPRVWDLSVTGDPRFAAALERAQATLPAPIAAEIDRLTTITKADIAAAQEQDSVARRTLRKEHPNARLGPARTEESTRKSLIFQRRNDLDWLFFRHWRLGDDWLRGPDTARALEIFHDPLAIAMRRAVLARLPPPRRRPISRSDPAPGSRKFRISGVDTSGGR